MVTFNVHGKEYKVVFGYGLLTKTDVLDKVQGITDGKERSLQKMISLLPELLLAGLQKKHKEEFGYESDSEKEAVLNKVCDLLDDYEDEGTEENPKSGFDFFSKYWPCADMLWRRNVCCSYCRCSAPEPEGGSG